MKVKAKYILITTSILLGVLVYFNLNKSSGEFFGIKDLPGFKNKETNKQSAPINEKKLKQSMMKIFSDKKLAIKAAASAEKLAKTSENQIKNFNSLYDDYKKIELEYDQAVENAKGEETPEVLEAHRKLESQYNKMKDIEQDSIKLTERMYSEIFNIVQGEGE